MKNYILGAAFLLAISVPSFISAQVTQAPLPIAPTRSSAGNLPPPPPPMVPATQNSAGQTVGAPSRTISGLTSAQVTSVINLLGSFGATQSAINNVRTVLTTNVRIVAASGSSSPAPRPAQAVQTRPSSGTSSSGSSSQTSDGAIRNTPSPAPRPIPSVTPTQQNQMCPTTMNIISCGAGFRAGGICNQECIPDGSTRQTSTVTLTASPTSGPAPLVVDFGINNNPDMSVNYAVDFGDGSQGSTVVRGFGCSTNNCPAVQGVYHTYTNAGTYTATLRDGATVTPCPPGVICPMAALSRTLGTVTITVSGQSPVVTNRTSNSSLGNDVNQVSSRTNIMNELSQNRTPLQPQSSPTYIWNRNLEIGSPYTADVTALQTALTREGVYSGEITGGFYEQTFNAVRAFQQRYGIGATGFVGPETRARLNLLYRTSANAVTSSSTPRPIIPTPAPTPQSVTAPQTPTTTTTPTITLSIIPLQGPGQTALFWRVDPLLTSCTGSGGWSGPIPTTGMRQIANASSPTTYALTCSDANGLTARQSVSVNGIVSTSSI